MKKRYNELTEEEKKELLNKYDIESIEEFVPEFYTMNLVKPIYIELQAIKNLQERYSNKELIMIENYNEIGIVEDVANNNYIIVDNKIYNEEDYTYQINEEIKQMRINTNDINNLLEELDYRYLEYINELDTDIYINKYEEDIIRYDRANKTINKYDRYGEELFFTIEEYEGIKRG